MMNDADKIRALMIYCQHWGREEARARRAAGGIRETMRLMRIFCGDDEEDKASLDEKLRRVFDCVGASSYLWAECADVLLHDCGGCFPPPDDNDYDDDEELLFDRKFLLEENLAPRSEDASYMIYDEDFRYEDVLSVDAIVALF